MPDDVYTSTLRLPREVADRLQLASVATGRTIASLLAEAVTGFVEQIEARPEHAARYAALRQRLNTTTTTENGPTSE